MPDSDQPVPACRGVTNSVHAYWRLAIMIIATRDAHSWNHRFWMFIAALPRQRGRSLRSSRAAIICLTTAESSTDVGGGDPLPAAVHVGGIAALDLHLNRGMGDVEPLFDVAHDRAKHLLALPHALLRHDDVAAAGDDARTDHPDVQIVDVENAVDVLHRGNHGGHVRAGRRALEEHGGAFAEHAVAAVEDQGGDDQGHD